MQDAFIDFHDILIKQFFELIRIRTFNGIICNLIQLKFILEII